MIFSSMGPLRQTRLSLFIYEQPDTQKYNDRPAYLCTLSCSGMQIYSFRGEKVEDAQGGHCGGIEQKQSISV